MKIALLMNDNSYPGREFLDKLYTFDIDVITIGNKGPVDRLEEERCGGLWKPKAQNLLKSNFKFFNFPSLNCEELTNFLAHKNYDFAIQGGVGILTPVIIKRFELGIINFHPGDLPQFRGCSAPEWQLHFGKNIISTAHLIDKGIDTGKIIKKKVLNVNLTSYYTFRASIYPETALFVREIVTIIKSDPKVIDFAEEQNHKEAVYRKYIGDEKIRELKCKLR